jgi:hypothetical protein
MGEQVQLRALARTVDTFERDQFSAWHHELDVSLTWARCCRKEVPRGREDLSGRVLEFAR